MKKSMQIFKESCAKLGISDVLPELPKAFFLVAMFTSLLRFFKLSKPSIAERHFKAVRAMYMLYIIAEARRGKWVPDYMNYGQRKWFPWFEGIADDKGNFSGFRFSGTCCGYTDTCAGAGSRLCFENEADAKWFGNELIDLHNDVLFLNK